ncbi:MAG: hypothetical protein AB7K09_11415 [Planctomycetota bacterium]
MTTRRQPLLTLALAVVTLAASGCTFGLSYKGQPDAGDPEVEFGKISCGQSAVQLQAIDGERTTYPELGPVSVNDGGFSVRVTPGLHALLISYQPSNPDGDRLDQPKRLIYGPPQVMTLDVPSGRELRLQVRELGGIRWEAFVAETKPVE